MKVLYLSYYFEPDITAAAFRSTDFTKFLQSTSEDIRVITTYPHKSFSEYTEEELSRDSVTRVRLRQLNNQKFISYLMHYLSFIPQSLKIAWSWRRKDWSPDMIFITSPPIFVGIAGVILKWLFRVPLITEIRDIWPDSAVAAGQITRGSWQYKFGALFEKFLYSRSSGLVCVSMPMKKYLSRFFRGPICVAYNGPKESEIVEIALKKSKGSQKEMMLAYAGNLGLVQGIDELILAIASLDNDEMKHTWSLDIFGTGVLEDELKTLSKEKRAIDRVRFRGTFIKTELNKHLAEMDALYLGLIDGEALDQTIPSKLFDYLSMGLPILGAIKGEGKDILEITGANVVAEECTKIEIVKGLLKLDHAYKSYQEKGIENRVLLRQKFTREINNQKILEFMQEVLRK